MTLHQTNRMATATETSSPATIRTLVVAQQDLQNGLADQLTAAGMSAVFAPDPYAAMTELCRRPLVYRAVAISLHGVYHEELNLIPAIKRRFPHVAIYLSHTDHRQAAMAEALRLGADGLISEQGAHHIAPPTPVVEMPPPAPASLAAAPLPPVMREVARPPREVEPLELRSSEPVLTAEELRALLEDEPVGGETA